MNITTTNKQLRAWADRSICPDLKEPVKFNDGKATVSEKVGRAMIKAHPETFSVAKAKGKTKK